MNLVWTTLNNYSAIILGYSRDHLHTSVNVENVGAFASVLYVLRDIYMSLFRRPRKRRRADITWPDVSALFGGDDDVHVALRDLLGYVTNPLREMAVVSQD